MGSAENGFPKGYKPTKRQLAARFKKGESGNPRGMTAEVAQKIKENARKATELREKLLSTVQSRMATIEVLAEQEAEGNEARANALKSERILGLLNSDLNRLLTDSENRGFGAPKQSMDIEDKRDRDPEDMTDEELAAIAQGEDPEDEDEQS